MEFLGFIAFIALLLGPVAFFMGLGARSRVEQLERERQERDLKLDDLLERVARIERQVRNLGPRPEATMGPAAEPAPPVPEVPQPPPLPDDVPPLEPAASADATIPEPLPSSEEAIPTQPDAAPVGALPAAAVDATITGPLPSSESDEIPTQPDAPADAAMPDMAATSPVERDEAMAVHASAAEPPPPPPAPPAPPPPVRRRSLEEAIGTR